MAGLLNAIGQGLGVAASAAQPFILNMQQAEIQKLRDARLAEIATSAEKAAYDLKKQRNVEESSSIESGAQRLLNEAVDRQAQSVSNTPGAAEFVRAEKGASELDIAKARSESARSLGLIGYQKDYGKEAKDIESSEYTKQRDTIKDTQHKETSEEAARHNRAMEAINALAKKNSAEGDTARIKNAKYLLENKIAASPADAWEKASELGGKNAEDVLLSTAQRIKSDADKNGIEMTMPDAVTQAKDLMKEVKGGNTSSGKITQKIPSIGEVRGGYKFKGGNPNDKASWEKI